MYWGVVRVAGFRSSESVRLGYFSLVVAVAFVSLTPPALLADMYSILESALLVLAMSLLGAWLFPSRTRIGPVPVALVALIGLMFLSAAWSSASVFTLRDAVAYAALAAAAWITIRVGGLHSVVFGVVGAGSLILLSSGVMALVAPERAFQYGTNWVSGIYRNRNQLGFSLLQCIPAAAVLPVRGRVGPIVRALTVGVFLAGVFVSGSRTSLIAGVAVVLVWVVVLSFLRSRIVGSVIAGGVAVMGLVGVWQWERVAALLGKGSTLNGRTEIWEALGGVIQENLLFGAGFLREWPGGSEQAIAVVEHTGTHFIHSHSDLLHFLTGVGAVGVFLWVVTVLLIVTGAFFALRGAHPQVGVWAAAAVAVYLVHGLGETSMMKPQGWFLVVAVVAAVTYFIPSGGPTWWHRLVWTPAGGRSLDADADADADSDSRRGRVGPPAESDRV